MTVNYDKEHDAIIAEMEPSEVNVIAGLLDNAIISYKEKYGDEHPSMAHEAFLINLKNITAVLKPFLT